MGDKATGETTVREGAPTRQILTDIAPYSWEHPADKAALQALRKIPVFDTVLRKLFSFVGEKPIRLAFQANAVRVSENQFGDIYRLYRRVLKTLDAPEEYPLFVSQTPMVNAGAYGMEQPFIILNSGTVRLIDEEELEYILGHEIGHILSDHVLYRTMTVFLLSLAIGVPANLSCSQAEENAAEGKSDAGSPDVDIDADASGFVPLRDQGIGPFFVPQQLKDGGSERFDDAAPRAGVGGV